MGTYKNLCDIFCLNKEDIYGDLGKGSCVLYLLVYLELNVKAGQFLTLPYSSYSSQFIICQPLPGMI